MRSKKNKINIIDSIIAIVLSVLAITMPITFTTLQPTIDLETQEIKQNPTINIFASIFRGVISFFDVVPSVSAEDPPVFGCCKETLNGAKCIITLENECKPGEWHEGESCENICQVGCCISNDGVCSQYTGSNECPVPPALKFIPNDLNCEQDVLCEKGCCKIGYQRRWTTEKTCVEIYSGVWDSNVPDEPTCLVSVEPEAMGCCRYDCKYQSVEECASKLAMSVLEVISQGIFVQRKCYQDVAGCDCDGETEKSCIPGFPDVYWMDSCGNTYLEDIANSCGDSQRCINNICQDSKCLDVYDNFDTAKGTFTAEPDFHGQERFEGESWCVYDMPLRTAYYAPIGSLDPVGSEHWLATCYEGEVILDHVPYRQQICEEVILNKNTGEIVMEGEFPMSRDKRYLDRTTYRSFAALSGNPWRVCYIIQNPDECNEQPYCYWIGKLNNYDFLTTELLDSVEMTPGDDLAGVGDETLKITETELGELGSPIRCLPRVSPGFNEDNKFWCEIAATVQCTLEDRLIGDSFPECDDKHWIELMAHRCRVVGDCGANMNWIGEHSYSGFLAAEIKPDKDTAENIIGKEIEVLFNVETDNDFQKFQTMVEARSIPGIVEFLGTIVGITFTLWGLFNIPYYFATGGLYVPILSLGVASAITSSAAYSWFTTSVLGFINPALLIGAAVLILASFLPVGAWRSTLEGIGWGLAAGGTMALLGASTLAGPIGVAVMIFYWAFFGVWDVDHIVVKCSGWMPPFGGDNCDKCNDPTRPCSKYRCESLGAACMYNDTIIIGQETYQLADSICTSEENDYTQPTMQSISVKDSQGGFVYVNPNTNIGLPPKTINIGQQIEPFTMLTFEIDFNKRVFCKWHDTSTGSIEEMVLPFGGVSFDEIKIEILGASSFPSDQQLYLRCVDVHGNANIAEYLLKFDVADIPDWAPPVILGTERDYNPYFGHGITELPLAIYVNEYATCRWNAGQDTAYDLMAENTECNTSLIQGVFTCDTTLTNLQPEIPNPFYIRCKDMSPQENVMQQGYELILYPTSALQIISIDPESGSTISGCEEITEVELTVETAEGANNGIATCYWSNQGFETGMTKFTETDSTIHYTEISAISQTIYIKCVDYALNIATEQADYIIYEDSDAPIITRIYEEAGSLVIRTNEDATCSFNFLGQDCQFAANDTLYATHFSQTGGKEHRTTWRNDPWYVKCYDDCMNGWEPWLSCMVIYPSEFE